MHENGAGPDSPAETGDSQLFRHFMFEDVEWLAWPSGSSAYGTGTCGPAALESVHFARADAADKPAFEALLPAGRFYGLFDEELITALRNAARIVEPGERPMKAANRRGAGLL